MVEWKTMALWFSLETECLLSAIFQLLNKKWAIIIRKHCFFSRFASSLSEGVCRQYIEKKCDKAQLVQISTWCKSVHWFTSLQAYSFLAPYTTEISLPCKIPLCACCVHLCYGAVITNRWHYCMQVKLNRTAVSSNLCTCGSWSPFWAEVLVYYQKKLFYKII